MSETKVIAIVRDDIPTELKAEMVSQGITPFALSNVLKKEAAYTAVGSTSSIAPRTFLCQGAKQVSRTCVDIHLAINLSILYGMEGLLSLRANNFEVMPAQRFARAIVSIHQYIDGELNPTYAAAQKYAQDLEDLGDAITMKRDLSVNLVANSGAFFCALGLAEPESFVLFEINKVAVEDTSNGIYESVLAANPKNFGDGITCGVRLVVDKLMLNNISLTATTGSLTKVEETGRTTYTFHSIKAARAANVLPSSRPLAPLDEPLEAAEPMFKPAPKAAAPVKVAVTAQAPDLGMDLPLM